MTGATGSRPRGVCPVCGRSLALRPNRELPAHRTRVRYGTRQTPEWCRGAGVQPTDQLTLATAPDDGVT